MLIKHKKKLLYALSFMMGVVVTIFAVQKDKNTEYELTGGFGVPIASADLPACPADGDMGDGDGDSDGG